MVEVEGAGKHKQFLACQFLYTAMQQLFFHRPDEDPEAIRFVGNHVGLIAKLHSHQLGE